MSLSEKHRGSIYLTLAPMLGEEEWLRQLTMWMAGALVAGMGVASGIASLIR